MCVGFFVPPAGNEQLRRELNHGVDRQLPVEVAGDPNVPGIRGLRGGLTSKLYMATDGKGWMVSAVPYRRQHQ